MTSSSLCLTLSSLLLGLGMAGPPPHTKEECKHKEETHDEEEPRVKEEGVQSPSAEHEETWVLKPGALTLWRVPLDGVASHSPKGCRSLSPLSESVLGILSIPGKRLSSQ